MNPSLIAEFEQKVISGLEACNFYLEKNKNLSLGAAVSGGADSVCLLISLCRILKKFNIPLYVISVNHFIRPAEETCGDLEFVRNLCVELKAKGYFVEFEAKEFKQGEILRFCEENKTGIEDGARKYRYSAFEDFIEKKHLDALCLAHNQNDQLETALMRFLQGGVLENLSGIPQKRNKFIRPLLQISRDEIEAYLKELNFTWRTDSTNFDTAYLRNKVRQRLIPVLNKEFAGWEKNVLKALEKGESQRELISSVVGKIPISLEENYAKIEKKDFLLENNAFKINLLLRACNLIGFSQRIPYSFLNETVSAIQHNFFANNENSNFVKEFGDLEIVCKKDLILVKKQEKSNTDLVFFDIMEESGKFDFPFGILEVFAGENSNCSLIINGETIEKKIKLPFCVRNLQLDDEIATAKGNFKKISDIFKDWHVLEDDKKKIPVIQNLVENQDITCILGKTLGYKNWIVK